MKVTNHGMKDRKLHQEGCPQKEVAEQPGYVEGKRIINRCIEKTMDL